MQTKSIANSQDDVFSLGNETNTKLIQSHDSLKISPILLKLIDRH